MLKLKCDKTVTSPYGKFACELTAEFSEKMSEGTQDIDLFLVGLHVCLLCALHTAISSQTLHGILHKGSTC